MTSPPSSDPSWFTTFSGQSGPIPENDKMNVSASTFSATSAISWANERRQGLRAWTEFFKTTKFGLPAGVAAVAPRIQHNLGYFFSNYLCVFIVLLVYCILTSFVMLLALIALGGLIYTIRQRTLKGPVVLGGHEVSSLLYIVKFL